MHCYKHFEYDYSIIVVRKKCAETTQPGHKGIIFYNFAQHISLNVIESRKRYNVYEKGINGHNMSCTACNVYINF